MLARLRRWGELVTFSHTIFALPFADNIGSVRVLEKAGYVREGLLRSSSVKFGQPRDQYLFARVNPTWINREGS